MDAHEREEANRLRRHAAVMRFLAQMYDIAGERDLVQALIQAAAVWFDLDARAYRRQLSGRLVAAMWLPGAELDGFPRSLEAGDLPIGTEPFRVSSMADLEQLGWQTFHQEILLLPVARGRQAEWVLVLAGPVDAEAEATLTVACRTAGAVLEQLQNAQSQDVAARVARKLANGQGSVPAIVQAALEELLAGVGASRGRLVFRGQGTGRPVTLALVGSSLEGVDLGDVEAGSRQVGALRITLGAKVTGGGVAAVLLDAPERAPFGLVEARAADAAMATLATWLGGVGAAGAGVPGIVASPAPARTVAQAATAAPGEAVPAAVADSIDPGVEPAGPVPPSPPEAVEAGADRSRSEATAGTLDAEVDRVRRLSLKGGVLVASVGGAPSTAQAAVGTVIEAIREELRSSDMLAQLAGGEVAALLVRSSAEGVVSAAWRVRKRLEQLSRERRLPPVSLGHTLYPAEGAETLAALVSRAKQKPNNPANPVEGWRFVLEA